MPKAKTFRVGVEGATTDGREIERDWLVQMAAQYNPELYTALINIEHITAFSPDNTFCRYGRVTGLSAAEITDGPLKGKMGLYADIEPTDSLVQIVGNMQKTFTSMEVNPKFADTGKAYLMGLAVTDDPASLGTEMLQFSAKAQHNPLAHRKHHKDCLFTAAEETVIEFMAEDDRPSLFDTVKALFTKKNQSDEKRFGDVHRAVELVAGEQQALGERVDGEFSEQAARLEKLETELAAQVADFAALKTTLSQEDSRPEKRPTAPGGESANYAQTNC